MVQQPTKVRDFKQIENGQFRGNAIQTQIDDTGTVVYIGQATSGTATSAATWRIKRVTSATGVVLWAAGVDTFSQIWDNRAALSYS